MSSFYLIIVGFVLIIGTYGDSASTNTASLYCPTNQFKCKDEEKCIHGSYQCDGITDCHDATDELKCVWLNCHDNEHRCEDGKCIRAKSVCDGIDDCPDRTEELRCGVNTCKVNEFMCRDGKKCIPARWRCDSQDQCADSSDESFCGPHECPDGQVLCDSGECLREELFCDGREKCRDGSDEKHCDYENSDIIFLNKGPNIYVKIKTKAGLKFTHVLPISVEMKTTGVHHGLKITGLAFDYKNQRLFVSDASEPAIRRFNISSFIWLDKDWKYEVKTGLESPTGIAYDYTSDNLYWIDSGTDKAEVTTVGTGRRTAIIKDILNPIALALSPKNGVMFIATTNGIDTYVLMYEMDGSNRRILDTVQGSPASLAVHPHDFLLYWTDPEEGTISAMNYFGNNHTKILRKNLDRVMSVTVTERDVYYTSGEPEDFTSQGVNRFTNPGSEKIEGWNCITSGTKPSGTYECLTDNGRCEYICLTSEFGRKCACPSGSTLAEDGLSCSLE